MKSVVKLSFIALLTTLISSGNKSIGDAKVEPASKWCGNPKRIELSLRGQKFPQFSIPEEYLFDPYDIWYKPTKPKNEMDFIQLLIRKSDAAPSCSRSKKNGGYGERGEDIVVDIKSSGPQAYSVYLDTELGVNTLDLGLEGNRFHLYRSTKEITGITSDILVPVSGPNVGNLFFKCAYGRAMINKSHPDYSAERTGCRAYSFVSSKLMLIYTLRPQDMSSYSQINERFKDTVNSFEISK